MRARLAIGALALATIGWGGPARADGARVIGDTTVFAAVPYPGHPGGVAVDGDIVYTATFNPVFQALDGYDAIFAYDLATGALLTDRPNPIEVPRMMPAAVMGLAGIALDAEGRLYVADMNGRIVRVDPLTGAQEDYATFPTDSDTSFTAMPAMLTFGDDGMLYVADGSAPVIWRVPVGGGEAEVWFTDPLLPSVWGYGYAGIRIDPTGTFMYLATQYASAAAIYRFPMSHPSHDALELMHLYEPPVPSLAERSSTGGIFGAGDIAFGASGKLYAVLVGRNAVSILRPDGTEEARFPGAAEAAAQEVPYDEPIFAAFDGAGSLLVGNASFRGPNSVIFDAWVGEAALPLARPSIAG